MTQPRKLILHIGHFKTGTTALQIFFHRNRLRLARGGLVYAATGMRNSKHSPLAFALLRDAGVTSLIYNYNDPKTARELWQELLDELRALPEGKALLVSSEEFMRFGAHPAAVELLRGILADAPDVDLRVIAYLRPPQSHLRSWFNQMHKLGHPCGDFNTAVRSQFEPIHWDYGLALDPWIALCGAEAVTLRGFSDALREGDAIYQDCVGALGYAMPWLAIRAISDPNPRIDDRLLPLRRGLNNAKLPKPMAERLMKQAAESLERGTLTPDGPDFAQIRKRSQDGIEALARLPGAGFDRDALLAQPPQEDASVDAASEAIIDTLTREIARLHKARKQPGGGSDKRGGGKKQPAGRGARNG